MNHGSRGRSRLHWHSHPPPHDYRPYLDLSELAEPLEGIVRILGSYVHNATLRENGLNLFTGRNSYPVRLVLEGEAVDRIADALSRMADALMRHKH